MTIAVRVDLTNPGQMLAACGLLEAADRRWRGKAFVTGRFEDSRFLVEGAPGNIDDLIAWLTSAEIEGVTRLAKPARKGPPRIDFEYGGSGDDAATLAWPDAGRWRLNSWSGEDFGRTPIKSFAGQMKGPKIIAYLLDYVRRVSPPYEENALGRALYGAEGAVFGFDASKGRTALEVGFATDKLGMGESEYPLTELLAALALQSFRPSTEGSHLMLGVWSQALPVELARAAAACAFEPPGLSRHRFRLLGRKARSGVEGAPNDQYKAFTRATPASNTKESAHA